MKTSLRTTFLILSAFLCLLKVSGQDNKLEDNTIAEPPKRINLLIKERVNRERGTLDISEAEIRRRIDSTHSFGIYKENYIITGSSLNKRINRTNSDAKYQISFRQRVTTSYLPFDTFIFIAYTQKSFWDIYKKSAPFLDTNFNPALGFGRYFISSDKNYTGSAFLQLEHESNGRDSIESRSWDFISASGKYYFSDKLFFRAEVWLPLLLFMESTNSDLISYKGYGNLSADYRTSDERWWLSAKISPRRNLITMNTTVSVAYRVSKIFNQYLFFELYNGRGDSLLDYKEYDFKLRLGICIKPDFISVF